MRRRRIQPKDGDVFRCRKDAKLRFYRDSKGRLMVCIWGKVRRKKCPDENDNS